MGRVQRALRPWLLMLLVLAAATGFRWMLDPLLGARFPLITYLPMTPFLALFAGAWPAGVAAVASAVFSELLFGSGNPGIADAVALAIYLSANGALIVLVERIRRARESAEQRERAARASEGRSVAQRLMFEAAVESVDTGVHSWAPASGEAQWDARIRTMFGLGVEEPETRATFLARVHPEDRGRLEAAVAQASNVAGPRRYSTEYRIIRGGDGALRWMKSTGFAVFEGDQLVRFVGTARDITERRQVEDALRESEQRFATLAEGSPVLLWVNGPAGAEFVNRAYLEFVGVGSDQDVRGDGWSRFVHADDREEYVNTYRRAYAAQSRFAVEFRFRRRDGEYRWMRSEATPRFSEDGELRGYVGATVDITERRAAEDALRLANRQKDEFLAMLAHELRNPLAPIRNASEVLALRYAGDPWTSEPIAMLRRQTDHLAALLDDLLDVTRIAQGRVTLKCEPLEIGAVIEHAVETVALTARAKEQLLRVQRGATGSFVSGDRTRLQQSLTNVLQNAVKYTRERGEIVVEVCEAGPDVEIAVRDNGVGISRDLLPHVFDLFVQGERTLDRSQGGLGIGLSVVKRLVEMHGGAVRAASEGLGRGATVAIRLPRIEPPEVSPSATVRSIASRRVLVVDDSADAADSLAMLLQIEGHDVATAYSASSALEAAERLQPDVAFIDIGLPVMDGYEVARRLRASERCRSIRLVALTGYGQPEDRDDAWRAGFDHHLVKPADLEVVGTILSQLAPRTGIGASAGSV